MSLLVRITLGLGALALVLATAPLAGPITKQNGSAPVIAAFTPICSVPGYASYGLCGGNPATFAGVTGRMNAVQPKPGAYNLDFRFGGLSAGTEYRLWSTVDGRTWSEVARAVAADSGELSFSLRTTAAAGLGFDLNTVAGDVTVVTTWWSAQRLRVNADGTLGAGGG